MLRIANQPYDAFTHSFWNTRPNIYSGLQSKWKEKKTETLRTTTLCGLKCSTLFLAGHTGNYLHKRENKFNSVIKRRRKLFSAANHSQKLREINEAEPDKKRHVIIMKHVHMHHQIILAQHSNAGEPILHYSRQQLKSTGNFISSIDLPCIFKSAY